MDHAWYDRQRRTDWIEAPYHKHHIFFCDSAFCWPCSVLNLLSFPFSFNPLSLFFSIIMGNARSALQRNSRKQNQSPLQPTRAMSISSGSVPGSVSSGAKATQSRIIGGREFHTEEKSVYVLAKDDEEKDRLHEV
jgi:hypothetical protein